ncbi:glycoside hydrolase family 128 protein [Hypoxylon sp. FL0890]|nr:glycoside hydrolase family 128 protein [Hypoxylon sp. FL0890]
MHNKISILALCAAASVKEVAAGSLHRHMHPKRDIVWAETDTVVITDYVTVTVTEGEEGPTALAVPTSAPDFKAQGGQFQSEYPTALASSTVSSSSLSSSSTSSSISSSSSTSIASPTVAAAEVTYPASSPTTLVTVKTSTPAAEAPTTSSAVESSTTEANPIAAIASTVEADVSAVVTSAAAAVSSLISTPTSSSSGTSKRGAAYNDASLVSTVLALGGKLSWAYNWTPDPNGLDSDVTYYPMLWSTASPHSDDWDTKAEAAIANGADALLSFNEPDNSGQANMSPAAAAAGQQQYFAKYAGKVRISSPAITSSESSGQGLDWLNQFFDACDGKCQVDFCAAHWYGPGGTDGAALFLDHITKVHEACDNKNVWVTEFAAESGDVDAFVSNVTQELDSDKYSFVEKYSYFWLSEGSLMQSTSVMSDFGKIFAGIA